MNKFQQLFWDLFVKNCKIDDEDVGDEDLETIKKMDKAQLLKVFKNFVEKLLDFKDKVKSLEVKELADRAQKFESVITKLESDVRTHIGMHYRLKIEIEAYKNAIEVLEKDLNEKKTEVKKLKTKNSLQERIIEKFKEKFESRKKIQPKIRIDTDHENNKIKSPAKVMTERSKSSTSLVKIPEFVKNKSRLAHLRCRSDFAKSLKVRIPT